MNNKKKIKLTVKDIFNTSYVYKIREWRNQDFVRKNMINRHIISEEEHKKYMDSIRESKNHRILMVLDSNNIPFGVICVNYYESSNNAETGLYLISENDIDTGSGIILLYLINEYVFHIWSDATITGTVLKTNTSALKMAKKYGSVLIYEDNDKIITSLTKRDWEQNKVSIQKILERFYDWKFEI